MAALYIAGMSSSARVSNIVLCLLQISVKGLLYTEIPEITILDMKCWLDLKTLVFFTFDWYFSMVQSEYTINEPANCIFATPKGD